MEKVHPEPPAERFSKRSSVQKLYLELLKHTQFHQLDGAVVARDLENHRHLWKAALLTSYLPDRDAQTLQGVAHGVPTLDTLLVWTDAPQQDALAILAGRWNPDALDWLSEYDLVPEADLPGGMTVLRVSWWDPGADQDALRPYREPWE